MAYVSANLVKLAGNGPTGAQLWSLSGVDAIATVRGAGFISDAKNMGMRVGDQVIYSDTATPLTSLSRVTAVASTGATMTA